MPIVTRTVAKGIPPRLHEAKGKGKARKKKSTGKNKKRSADSGSEGDDGGRTSDESRAVYKVKREKHRHIELSESDTEDLETIDQDASEPPAEEVDMSEGEVAGQQASSEAEVSTYHRPFRSWTLTIQ